MGAVLEFLISSKRPDPILLGFSKDCGSRSEFPQGSPDSWTVARDDVYVKLHQGHSQASGIENVDIQRGQRCFLMETNCVT